MKRSICRLNIIGGLLFVVSSAAGQRLPQIETDYASFAYDAQESLVEFYLAVEARSLMDAAQDDEHHAVIRLYLRRMNSSETNMDSTEDRPVWVEELDFSVPDTSSIIDGQIFLHKVRFMATPGEYELQIDLPVPGQDAVQVSRDVTISDYHQPERCLLSDIILASSIVDSGDKEVSHYKNGLVILPNMRQLYGADSAELFYYAEAYNPGCAASDSGMYTLLTYVTEAGRATPVPDYRKRWKRDVHQTDILHGAFDLSNLGSGTYFLRMAILDSNDEVVVEQKRKFFVFNPSVKRSAINGTASAEALDKNIAAFMMSEEELEREWRYIAVILNNQESRRMKRLEGLDARRRLLMEFWKVRDPTPGTGRNEFRDEFYRLMRYANERYSMQRIEGWETDRGNVLLRYGRPGSIEANLYERGRKPYEVWTYDHLPGEGQAEFIFADLDGFGEFELIHSTVAGERKLFDWTERISERY